MKNPSSYSSSSSNFQVHHIQDPDEEEEEVSTEANMEVWKLLPQLQNVPEATLKKLPLSAIFQLSNALVKSSKMSDKLGVNSRLAANAQNLLKNPVQVNSGQDNRKTILHEGRFLGGACCSMNDIWLKGKEVVGPKGPIPVSCYDLDSVGCGGSVTARGWKELHDPSSQELKIKQFYLPNVAGSGASAKKYSIGESGEEISFGESLKEIGDLDGYRGALNVLREAMASALPWNRSISAISGFMCNTNYLQADLGGNTKRAGILAEFTDYVLGRNALNWDNGHPFITTDEMAHVWANWKSKRSALFSSSTGGQAGKHDRSRASNNSKEKYKEANACCKRFNAKTCPKQADKECVSFFGAKLKHICNKFTPTGICGKDHPRADHT